MNADDYVAEKRRAGRKKKSVLHAMHLPLLTVNAGSTKGIKKELFNFEQLFFNI